ncbi:Ribosomal protein lysine methyltransferase [Ophidiomyces ophidiicola]|nr:Ribosomal protein lysine methyltransferase [Ophidiomyces ophidiicola]KAI2048382.1 Ribosomal protein lysine methyltransferase [Ophidiomyces ophidiicola]KAI2051184.1 Ribosomal protein lysine methyltransferase [Ophidiomyces ophidiicola]KAI2073346.1 Ribosomal protein lysine methyltransferase [Ophidiomyces ophidiicola]KAI2075580.1 Ribosomal protein lysine methyltransferase [Ophidiomyces ophidiicola]
MKFSDFLDAIGDEVEDAEEEAFLLFSQDIPSQNLGFVDSQSHSVEISVHDRDLTIRQSPTLLSSRRAGGTTGAVLWKITPIFAQWLCQQTNILWEACVLRQDSSAIELGCGVAGVLALSLGPSIRLYTATDQEYVRKLFQENKEQNYQPGSGYHAAKQASAAHSRNTNHPRFYKPNSNTTGRLSADSHSRSRTRHHTHSNTLSKSPSSRSGKSNQNIHFMPLDWETDTASDLVATAPDGFDVLLACDCIYNDALIAPFVQTCVDVARLRPSLGVSAAQGYGDALLKPTVCIIAQQLRAHEVFESWLRTSCADFAVWRVKDEVLGTGLGTGSGYVVHVLVLRE